MLLHNRVNKVELKTRLYEGDFTRRTISFYRYFDIGDPQEYRDNLYMLWSELNCFGRIYVAREGVNAQMSVPEDKLPLFLKELNEIPGLMDMPIPTVPTMIVTSSSYNARPAAQDTKDAVPPNARRSSTFLPKNS